MSWLREAGPWTLWWTTVGLFIGSFLNVAIHRLPRDGESVNKPRRSRCPACRTELTWRENIPLLSWILQLGRCRNCAWRIPVRYPLVELLTAGLWYLAATATTPGDHGVFLVRALVLSGLVVATFVDFDFLEIPDEVSIGGMVAAPVLCLLVPQLHADTWVAQYVSDSVPVDRFGALVGCMAGMAVGWSVLWLIGRVGTRAYGTDAMGFGDVKLLAAGGGFVGPGATLAALMLAALVASVVGTANMARFFFLTRSRARERGRPALLGRSIRIARIAGRYLPFGPYLALGIGIVLLYWKDVLTWVP